MFISTIIKFSQETLLAVRFSFEFQSFQLDQFLITEKINCELKYKPQMEVPSLPSNVYYWFLEFMKLVLNEYR